MHLLALDIGNSATKAGLYHGEKLVNTLRFSQGAEDELLSWVDPESIDVVASVSVVPKYSEYLADLVAREMGLPLHEYSAYSRLPFAMSYETPETLGSDRVAASVGAWLRAGGQGTVVVVDAGTALTIEVITEQAGYLGGVIAPGPALLRDVLASGTAQLPMVDMPEAPPPIGRSTAAAIRSGVMNGFVGAAEGLLERIHEAHPDVGQVVMTGGWAGLLSRRLRFDVELAPDLVLEGVAAMHRLNRQDQR